MRSTSSGSKSSKGRKGKTSLAREEKTPGKVCHDARSRLFRRSAAICNVDLKLGDPLAPLATSNNILSALSGD